MRFLLLGLTFGPGQAQGKNLSAGPVLCKYCQYFDKIMCVRCRWSASCFSGVK